MKKHWYSATVILAALSKFLMQNPTNKPVRPMEIVRDKNGYCWLCDKDIDPKKDLGEQGCWQCGGLEMPFTRND
jgi:hypothetical protein